MYMNAPDDSHDPMSEESPPPLSLEDEKNWLQEMKISIAQYPNWEFVHSLRGMMQNISLQLACIEESRWNVENYYLYKSRLCIYMKTMSSKKQTTSVEDYKQFGRKALE